MVEDNTGPKGGRKTTKVVHIGANRFEGLDDRAISLSYQLGARFTPSQIMQYLYDKYLDVGTAQLAKEFKESVARSEQPCVSGSQALSNLIRD